MHPHFRHLVVAVLLLIPGFAYSQFDFGLPISLKTKITNPSSLQHGDFNGDGKDDFAFSNQGTTSSEMYFAISNGTGYDISEPIHLDVAEIWYGYFKVADLNLDNKDDIAIFSYGIPPPYDHYEMKVQLLLSSGGQHIPRVIPINQPVSGAYYSFNVTDYASDGVMDIVLTDYTGPAVVLNTFNGFTPGFAYDLSYFPGTVEYFDIDNNGIKDPVLVGGSGMSTYVYIPGFPFAFYTPLITTQANILDYRISDFNSDGRKDILVLLDNTPRDVQLFLNNGNGTFADPVQVGTASAGGIMDAADFDGDGRTDIVTYSPDFTGIQLYKNTSSGFNISSIQQRSLNTPRGIAFADMDGDHVLEVAQLQKDDIVLYKAGYDFLGTFRGFTFNYDIPLSFSADSGTIADIDNDGFPDIISGSSTSGSITVHRGKGNFQFHEPVSLKYDADGTYGSRIVGDLNGDGFKDIFYSSDWNSGVIENVNGSFGDALPMQTPTNGAPQKTIGKTATGADFNNDGKVDVFGRMFMLFGTAVNNEFIFSNHSFTPEISSITTADFTGDGYQDVLLTSAPWVSLFPNQGYTPGPAGPTPGFITHTTVPGTANINYVTAVSLGIDGLPDFISMKGLTDNVFYININNGDGTFLIIPVFNPTGNFNGLPYPTDLDGDGKAEIIAPVESGFYVYRSNPDGQLEKISDAYLPYENGALVQPGIAVGDLNNDHRQDVVFFDVNSPNTIKIMPGVGPPKQGATNLQASNITETEVTLTLQKGDGNGRIILYTRLPMDQQFQTIRFFTRTTLY